MVPTRVPDWQTLHGLLLVNNGVIVCWLHTAFNLYNQAYTNATLTLPIIYDNYFYLGSCGTNITGKSFTVFNIYVVSKSQVLVGVSTIGAAVTGNIPDCYVIVIGT